MCAPKDLKQRVDPGLFEMFPAGDIRIHIQRDLIEKGSLAFSLPGKGEFEIGLED